MYFDTYEMGPGDYSYSDWGRRPWNYTCMEGLSLLIGKVELGNNGEAFRCNFQISDLWLWNLSISLRKRTVTHATIRNGTWLDCKALATPRNTRDGK